MTAKSPVECRRNGDPRQRVLFVATLFTPDGAQRIRVRDLSTGGARIFAQEPLSGEYDAIFKRGGIFAAARVVWTSGTEAGLSFYRPLEAGDISGVMQQAG